MNFDSKAYAERIKDLRTRRGLTHAQFAEEIGISTNYLAKIENNRQSGSIDLAIDVAVFFDVSLDYLLLGKYHSNQDIKHVLREMIENLSALEETL